VLGLHVFSQTRAADSAGDSESGQCRTCMKRWRSLQALSKMCKNFQVPEVLQMVAGVNPIPFNNDDERILTTAQVRAI